MRALEEFSRYRNWALTSSAREHPRPVNDRPLSNPARIDKGAEPTMAEEGGKTPQPGGQTEALLRERSGNFAILEEAARSYLPPEDVERVKEAYRFALSPTDRSRAASPTSTAQVKVAIIFAPKTCACNRSALAHVRGRRGGHQRRLRADQPLASRSPVRGRLTKLSRTSPWPSLSENVRRSTCARCSWPRPRTSASSSSSWPTVSTTCGRLSPSRRPAHLEAQTIDMLPPLANRLGVQLRWIEDQGPSSLPEPAHHRSIAMVARPATSASATSKRSSASCAPSSTSR